MPDVRESAIVGFIEGLVLVTEFLLCLTVCTSLGNHALRYVPIQSSCTGGGLSEILCRIITIPISLIGWSISSALVLSWMVYRYPYLATAPLEPLHPWFGLKRFSYFFPSKTALLVSLLLVSEFVITVIWSAYFSADAPQSVFRVMNYDLYIKEDASLEEFLISLESGSLTSFSFVDWGRWFRIIILTPVVEEFVFRGLLLSTILHRVKRLGWKAIILPNIIFGLFHLLNLPSSRFSSSYIFLQIVIGVVVGIFFTVHLLHVGSLYDCIFMHTVNNFLSSLLPRSASLSDLMTSSALIQLCWTFACYTALVYITVKALPFKSKHKRK